MSVASLKAHLTLNCPPTIGSAYELASRYRVTEETARDHLRSNGYYYSKETNTWHRQETQLDRIEKMLLQLTSTSTSDNA